MRLKGAAGIKLNNLDAADIKSYLYQDSGTPAAAARWDPVLTMLGNTGPISKVFRTPLMVGLARTIYNPRPRVKCIAAGSSRVVRSGTIRDSQGI